jgi:ketosteroid isomerase-like protein
MTTPVETVQNFYAALASGNAPIALGLMADDIEWITMWHYKVDGRGPQKVGASGKMADARYAHVWTVVDGRIKRFRQYIDTLAVAEARK